MKTPLNRPKKNAPDVPQKPPRGMWFETSASSAKPYRARWRLPGGTKESQEFESERDRWDFAEAWSKRRAQHGRDAVSVSPKDAELLSLLREEAGSGVDLLAVIREWKRMRGDAEGRITIASAVEKWREAIKGQPATKDSIDQRNLHLDRLAAYFGKTGTLADLTPERIIDWLDELKPPRAGGVAAPRTKRAHRGTLSRLLEYAVAIGWLTRSPMGAVPVPVPPKDDVAILTPAQARRLFDAARGTPAAARLALEAFGGLRFSSAQRISAEDLRADVGGITFPAALHKTGKRHYVEGFPENLWAWLATATPSTWAMHPRVYADRKRVFFEAADLKGGDNDAEEVRNCLRHSFATYHLALHRSAAKTAYLLTHSNATMLYQHYAGRAGKADAEAYFAILP